MEKVLYNISARYADITKTMWLTFFYAPAIPFGTLISLISLLFYYWIDKVYFLK